MTRLIVKVQVLPPSARVTDGTLGKRSWQFLQVMAPREIRGRVMSIYSISLIGLPALGSLGSGAVSQLLGGISGSPRAVLIGAGIVLIVVATAAPAFWRQDQVVAKP